MTKQILEHSIEVTKLVCHELSKATEKAVQGRGNEYDLKFTASKRIGNPYFTLSSSALRRVVSPKLDGSIEYDSPGSTRPESGKFYVVVDGSRVKLIHHGQPISIDDASDLLLTPFLGSPVTY
ncbi:MAG: hypothetical protein AABN33_12565 [Acidobacteriota bacterium]